MKIHPYAVSPLTDRPPFTRPGQAQTLRPRSSWGLVVASIGGILLALLGLFTGG
ncbi:MAG TPA: hypothetical protein VMP67_09490 [Candidatus Limnocylindria bacterium]|nr:hypothetical protein [Candidatus Limnocylindria bacterium]